MAVGYIEKVKDDISLGMGSSTHRHISRRARELSEFTSFSSDS
jgi:hypothetical protein